MRRDDRSRYEESVSVVIAAAGSLVAVGAGCLVGLVHPIIEFVFGSRWLPATTAVQFCLLGTIPTAIFNALAADANARQMVRLILLSALIGGGTSLIILIPLMLIGGIGGASAAAYCVGPAAAAAVFVVGLHVAIGRSILRIVRLFAPLALLSFLLGGFANDPFQFVAACAVMAAVGALSVCLLERALAKRIWRMLRRSPSPDPVI
jgi:O-antigen/teichoic acid export membrane protein